MKIRYYVIIVSVILLIGMGLWVWQSEKSSTKPQPVEFSDDTKSTDLQGDIKMMWETQQLKGNPDPSHGPNPRSSTNRAIDAASRVFNTIVLIGKTREETIALLGNPVKSNDSIYNFPFYPAPERSLVYRFDNGAYGWQFNIIFNGNGKIQEIQRKGIE